jgi:uncharacterized membrane protein YphA (DoxX/SURF4 family)
MAKYSAPILRIGMSLVFLWFGTQQLLHTAMWTSLIPHYVLTLSRLDASTLVHLNGAFEIIFGLALIIGIFPRVVSLLLALHMIDIAFTVGYNAIGVRDFGLSMAAIAVFLNGSDIWTLDSYLARKRVLSNSDTVSSL